MKWLSLLLMGLPLMAAADIYKVIDASGNVTYTNFPVKNGQRVMIDDSPGGGVIPAKPRASAAVGTASPASFPRVDADTQKKRDVTRKQVLEDEMADEVRLLGEARKALNDGAAQRLPGDKLAQLQDSVTLHEKNIDALKKELAGIKEF